MSDTTKEETTPDELMEHFHGRSLKTIVLFTLVVHAVLLVGTSIPSIVRAAMGGDTSEMSEQERIDKAVREAKASLSEIAEQHGLKPQDLSSQFAGGKARAPRASATSKADPTPGDPATSTPAEGEPATDPEDPKSAIEKELDVKADGPALPKVEDEDEDLFK